MAPNCRGERVWLARCMATLAKGRRSVSRRCGRSARVRPSPARASSRMRACEKLALKLRFDDGPIEVVEKARMFEPACVSNSLTHARPRRGTAASEARAGPSCAIRRSIARTITKAPSLRPMPAMQWACQRPPTDGAGSSVSLSSVETAMTRSATKPTGVGRPSTGTSRMTMRVVAVAATALRPSFQAQVDHRHALAPHVDHAGQEGRCLGKGRDLAQVQDLPDLADVDAEDLGPEPEREILLGGRHATHLRTGLARSGRKGGARGQARGRGPARLGNGRTRVRRPGGRPCRRRRRARPCRARSPRRP